MSAQPVFDDPTLCTAMRDSGLNFSYHEHKPVFTVEESTELNDTLPEGVHIKNLFLKDRKKNFFLVSLEEHQQVNLKALSKTIGAKGGVSFANPEQLWDHLAVKPGSVTPFAILNAEKGQVTQFIDDNIYQSTYFLAHPLRNDRTICVETKPALTWLIDQGYPITRLDFSQDIPHIIS